MALKLSPPWAKIAAEMSQMFKYDAEVHVVYDEDEQTVSLFVDTPDKAFALTNLLPEEYVFGNVTLKVRVVPANGLRASSGSLFEAAFENNGAFSFVKEIKGIFTNNLTYVVFKKRVVQFFNDNLGDYYGNCSTLYETIARDLFGEQEGVCFCTDVADPVFTESDIAIEWP